MVPVLKFCMGGTSVWLGTYLASVYMDQGNVHRIVENESNLQKLYRKVDKVGECAIALAFITGGLALMGAGFSGLVISTAIMFKASDLLVLCAFSCWMGIIAVKIISPKKSDKPQEEVQSSPIKNNFFTGQADRTPRNRCSPHSNSNR